MNKFFSAKINKFLLHPFLFALYPALFLYSQNINHFREEVLVTPILLTLLLASSLYLISLVIFKKGEATALFCSFFLLLFFSYSRSKEFLKPFDHPDRLLSLNFILAIIIFVYLTFRYKKYLLRLNKAATFLSLILFSIAVFNIAFFEIKSGRAFINLTSEGTGAEDSESSQKNPDIYYFVMDRYAGEKTLNLYGFDNSSFYSFLEEKGFYIARDSTSNYPKTFLSLGSSLNLDYLNYLTEKTKGGATSDESYVTPLVQNNKVIKFLKKKGYSYIHVGSGWDPTRSNKNADRNFVMSGGRYLFQDEFMSGFLQTTLAAPILKRMFPDTTAVSQNPKDNDHRSRVVYQFEVFSEISKIPGPKFVFAHILLPHDPYVLGKDCEPIDEKTETKRSWIENYLNQMQCTNTKVKVTIDNILANSAQKPIIIIQADEGPMPMKYPVPFDLAWSRASDETIREKFPILNAYLLPDLKENPVYPDITPVNSFRIIFNNYFNTKYPLLPDKNYAFEDKESYYKFIDVTQKN